MDLAKAMQEERERLAKREEELLKQIEELEAQIAANNAEIKAIEAYEAAKTGKKKTKGRKTGLTDKILDLLKGKNLKRAEIIEELGVKGDKGKEQTVSNTLSNLRKSGKITAEGGVYTVA